jgi:phage replication O-like protein O
VANPQAENGHLKIAHEIVEQLYASPLSGSELRVVLFVLRKTWGWQKKEDYLSISQVEKATKLNRTTVVETLNKLVAKRLLGVAKGQLGISINAYQFNKNYDEWVVGKRQLGSYQKTTRVVAKSQPKLVAKRQPTKEKKETNTKERVPADERQAPSAPLFELVNHVTQTQGLKPFPSKERQFQAAKRILASGYSLDEAKEAIERMAADPYWQDRTFDVPALARNITRYSKPTSAPIFIDLDALREERERRPIMAKTTLTSLQEAARHLLNEIAAGRDVQLEVTGRDTKTGALLRLIMEVHEAAVQCQTGVVIEPVTDDTIRLRIASDARPRVARQERDQRLSVGLTKWE